ncbi:MAG: MOSC domain-containing protein [Pseudomonadota bacterium]
MADYGRIIGIARRGERRAPMEKIRAGKISVAAGLDGDFKGTKHRKRQITILAEEDWQAALSDLPEDGASLPWTVRRANLLCHGLRLPRAKGAILKIGNVELEVTGQTWPCKRMDEAFSGLLKALSQEWRGGVTCAVLHGGEVELGDTIEIVSAPEEIVRTLPG